MNISTPGEKGVLIMCFMLVCAGAEQKERETERETERERERGFITRYGDLMSVYNTHILLVGHDTD